jgi:hypothetical protein
LKRLPPQASQGTNTSAMNTISTSSAPAPSQCSQRPPATLKLKSARRCSRAAAPAAGRRTAADLVVRLHVGDRIGARRRRSGSGPRAPRRRDAPAGERRRTRPRVSPRCSLAECSPCSARSSARKSTSCTRVLLPEPETPVTTVSAPRAGMRTSTPCRLCARAPRSVSQRGPTSRRVTGSGWCARPVRYWPVSGLSAPRGTWGRRTPRAPLLAGSRAPAPPCSRRCASPRGRAPP